MIIVMTNRRLPVNPVSTPEVIKVTDIGVVLGDLDETDRLHCGLLSDDAHTVQFYPRDNTAELFEHIPQLERDKPWVLFVHGFHQDPDENLAKARDLHRNHGVNVIAFAWPSRPQNHTMDLDDAKQQIVKDTLMNALGKTTLLNMAIKYAKGYLKDFWENYEPAIANAEASDVDLLAAMTLVKQHLHSRTPPVLLIHSMGNYLLQSTLQGVNQLPLVFNNIVLHQADVNANGHDWANKLMNNLHGTAKLYITTNMYDGVLAASCARRGLLNKTDRERLGQTRQYYDVDDAHYLDFTDGPGIETDHEMFRRSKGKTNEYVFDLLGRIFRSDIDGLPVDEDEPSSGFIKMSTQDYLYRLEVINDPIPLEDEDFDDGF